jgi:hypothetical protein
MNLCKSGSDDHIGLHIVQPIVFPHKPRNCFFSSGPETVTVIHFVSAIEYVIRRFLRSFCSKASNDLYTLSVSPQTISIR